MMVPTSRLLFWFAVIALPFSVVGAVHAEAGAWAILGIAMLGTVVLLDAVLSYGGLEGIAVKLPEVVRLSKERAGTFEVRVQNRKQKARRLRLGLALPRSLSSPAEEVQVALPAGSEWVRLEWRCTPRQRGHYRLTRARLETVSPLGFWAVRRTPAVNAELRVYPNLLSERKHLAALFLNRGAFGIHAQRQVGKGREFEKLRDYNPGDNFEDIHWKATARRGRPITKVFQIERTQEVYVVIDASRLSARPAAVAEARMELAGGSAAGLPADAALEDLAPPPTAALERFITAALVLGLAAEHQGDLFGLATFSNTVDRFLRARNGQAHYSACRDALYRVEPREVAPDFDEVASFIRLRLRRRALLIFLTALDDPVAAESFVRNMDLLCHQHLVLVNMLRPPGAEPLFSGPDVAAVDDLYQRLGGHLRWHNLRELEKVLQRRGVKFSLLENEKLSVQLVAQYLGVKQRQLL